MFHIVKTSPIAQANICRDRRKLNSQPLSVGSSKPRPHNRPRWRARRDADHSLLRRVRLEKFPSHEGAL